MKQILCQKRGYIGICPISCKFKEKRGRLSLFTRGFFFFFWEIIWNFWVKYFHFWVSSGRGRIGKQFIRSGRNTPPVRVGMKALVPKAPKNEQWRTHTVILNLVQNLKINQTLKRVQGDKESANILNSFGCPACKGGVIYLNCHDCSSKCSN
jgi:hypothetical protein